MGFDAVIDSAKLNGALTATAEAIRSKTDSAEPITFDMDEGFKEAVDSIATGGGDTEAAYNEGVEAGKKAEYDAFWDVYQDNGNRTVYGFAFAGKGWTNETFKPKYDINQTSGYASQVFNEAEITDLIKILNQQGVVLNTSGTRHFPQFAQNAKIEAFPIIDFSNAGGSTAYAFSSPYLKSIEKLIVSEVTNWVATAFQSATELESVIFEGVMAKNNLNLQWSTKLSKASITSIINCLSTTTSGLTVTLSKTAKETAFTADEWTALANTRSNWTITLV